MNLTDIQEIAPGKSRAQLPLPGGGGLPVWTIQGAYPGPTLVLTAGVHGCEYVGIVALRILFEQTAPETLQGRLLLLPLLNAGGFFQGRKRIVPEDGKNLNRVFPAPADGSRSEQIAWTVQEQVYPEADFLLDLHGGDSNEVMTPLVFFPGDAAPAVTERSRAAAGHLEVGYRVPASTTNGLYSCAARRGIPALLLEIGGLGCWSQDQVQQELRSIRSLMGFLGMGTAARVHRDSRRRPKPFTWSPTPTGSGFPGSMRTRRSAKGTSWGSWRVWTARRSRPSGQNLTAWSGITPSPWGFPGGSPWWPTAAAAEQVGSRSIKNGI